MTAMTNAPPLPEPPNYQGMFQADQLVAVHDYADALRAIATTLRDQLAEQTARADANEKNYNELIMGVTRKWPNETRHQTALRYILEREESGGQTGCAALAKS